VKLLGLRAHAYPSSGRFPDKPALTGCCLNRFPPLVLNRVFYLGICEHDDAKSYVCTFMKFVVEFVGY